MRAVALVVAAGLAVLTAPADVHGDVYMHNPRGSNNRNCEENAAANNQNRLFRSENNANGGYSNGRAYPFSCYTQENQTLRDECNRLNYNISDAMPTGVADKEGVLHPLGTRTPRMYYYEGSILQIEWTNQHGCGENPRLHCDIILQYACEDTLSDDCGEEGSGKTCGPRDGIPVTNDRRQVPVSGDNDAVYRSVFPNEGATRLNRRDRDQEGTRTIPVSIDHDVQSDVRFGRHEPLDYYVRCRQRERNKGLFTAERNVNNNAGAAATRQNNNGERYGLECGEEADYWPYWHHSPWKDIAILTSRPERCSEVVMESQNVKEKNECDCPSCIANNQPVPNNRNGCTGSGGTWIVYPAHNVPAPQCGPAPTTRENHLGNPIGGGKSASSYNWTLPVNVAAGEYCVLRLRYNISSGDPMDDGRPVTIFGTSGQNGANSPVKDRQAAEIGAYKGFNELLMQDHPAARLATQVNTNQFGRTFQDRSHTFRIVPAPRTGWCAGKKIHNLNVRGRKGNIVQVYPSVEYDYSPSELTVSDMDCIHVQWTGTDYGPERNANNNAFGGPPQPFNLRTDRGDRHNLVQVPWMDHHAPVQSLDYEWNMFKTERARKIFLAFIGQPIDDTQSCMPIEDIRALAELAKTNPGGRFTADGGLFLTDNANVKGRYSKNCGFLSAAKTPYFDGGLFQPGSPGRYGFMDTRNNCFTNRRVSGILNVQSAVLTNGSIVYVVVAAAAGIGLAAAGLFVVRRRSRNKAALADLGVKPAAAASGGWFGRSKAAPAEGAAVAAVAEPAAPRRNRPGQAVPVAAATTTVTALYNHVPSESGELAFKKGDIVVVLQKDDSGWWHGRTTDGKTGIFPSNYVQ